MKNSIKKFESKKVKDSKVIKGGGFGKGTKKQTTTSVSARPELM